MLFTRGGWLGGVFTPRLEELCARHAHKLGGVSPLQALQCELLAKGKGVHREVESEGSRRQNLGPTNRNRM